MKETPDLTLIVDVLRCELPFLKDRYHVEKLGIFGSYRHQRQKADSDLDLLVSFTENPGFFKYIEIEHYLEDLLGIKVDLVMETALKPRIGKRILGEVLPV